MAGRRGSWLRAEISLDFLHPAGLRHVEGAAAVTVAAADTIPGLFLQLIVVAARQFVPGPRQIVILVDDADVQPRRAGLAVVAVYTDAGGVLRGKRAEDGIIPFLRGGVQEAQDALQVCAVPHTGQHGEHTRLIQRVLDALVFGQRPAEGRGARIQQLAAAERLHHRDAHALRFTPAVNAHVR